MAAEMERLSRMDTRTRTVPNIDSLTGLRAYAAVWVMLLHLQFGLGIKGQAWLGAVVNHGFWAVDVFFVLSGFILSLLYADKFDRRFDLREYWTYLSARFSRIYPLHFAALTVLAGFMLLYRLDGGHLGPGFGLRYLALNLSLLHGWGYADRLNWNYPSWSISTEWFAYLLLLPLYARALRRLPVAAIVGLGLIAWSLLYAAVHGEGDLIGTQAVSWSPPRIAAEFLLGYSLFRVYRRYVLKPQVSDALALAGLGTIVLLCFAPDAAEWWLAPAVCALVFGLARPGPIGNRLFAGRWAVFWGERSYSIYMLHAVVQILANAVVLALGLEHMPRLLAWAAFAAQAAVVVGASHLAYEWIELPLRARLRTLLERGLSQRSGGTLTAERTVP